MAYPNKMTKSNASPLDEVPLSRRVRVTRTLVFEGPEAWVKNVMELSWVHPDRPIDFCGGEKTVVETSRVEEIL